MNIARTHYFFYCFLLFSTVFLSACGGGSSTSANNNQSPGVATDGPLLSALVTSTGLDQAFQGSQLAYTAPGTGFLDACITITATPVDAAANLTVGGQSVNAGEPVQVELAEGANSINVVVTLAGQNTTYSIDVTREAVTAFAQRAYVKASNTDMNDTDIANGQDGFDEFGSSVALSGNTLAIGARFEDGGASGVNGDESDQSAATSRSGAVYVFTRDVNGDWSQQAYLKASNNSGNDEFGFSVALQADTLVVGAPSEDGDGVGVNPPIGTNAGAANSGAAYVFTRDNNGVWSEQAHIKASNTDNGDRFGESVALSDETLAVGARFEDSDAIGISGEQSNNDSRDSGAVYIFTRSNNQWSQQAYVKASNAELSDAFGVVALSGDTLAVSAYGEDSSAQGINGDQNNNDAQFSGAVYVFTRSNNEWSQQAYIKASNASSNDLFGAQILGNSISTSIVLDGDTLVVGATGEDSSGLGVNADQSDNSANGSGAVYVFTRSGGQWSQQAFLKASNTGGFDVFGHSLSINGDLLAISARFENSNARGINGDQLNNDFINSGAVYLFTRCNGAWTQQAYVKSSNNDARDWFGHSVAIDGGTLVASANFEDSDARGINGDETNNNVDTINGERAGAAYIFE
ncbi:cadherin-like beta sandwich domain-containing protein [Beggiatoa alba]|nr:cadherin-like beta sandwich domain-containing protein [Beggiatoa alba]